jgi:hypothetical protein
MRSPLRSSLAAVAVAAAVAGAAGAAQADTVRFATGKGSTLSDGRIHCNVGTDERGVGLVQCSGAEVWQRWERKATCADGYVGLRAIRLREQGRSGKGENCGVGGSIDSSRGDTIVAGDIRGRHLAGGGFTFRNADGHGFTLTANRLTTF